MKTRELSLQEMQQIDGGRLNNLFNLASDMTSVSANNSFGFSYSSTDADGSSEHYSFGDNSGIGYQTWS